MIRFTLLQARIQIFIALAALAVVGILLAATSHAAASSAVVCSNVHPCFGTDIRPFYEIVGGLAGNLLIVIPAIIGIFWGAPLVAREFDYSTQELVLTQSVTRTRWLTTKLLCLGLLAVSVTALLSLMLTAWAHHIDALDKAPFGTFDQRDIAPIAHTALAFVLGVTVGFVAKRVVPAMVVTLILVVAFAVADTTYVRPHLATPKQQVARVSDATTISSTSLDGKEMYMQPWAPQIDGALIMRTTFVDANGKISKSLGVDISGSGACADLYRLERNRSASDDEVNAAHDNCFAAVDATYDVKVTYQPASNYWKIQWLESAIYVGLALLIGGLSIAYIRRNAS